MFARYLKFISLLLVAAALSGCGTHTSERRTADYDTALMHGRTALLLPSTVEVVTLDAGNGQKRMYDYEMHLEDAINSALSTELATHSFRVNKLSRRQVHEQKLDDSFMKFRRAYSSAREELYAKGSTMEKEKAFAITNNVGPAAAELGEKTNSDLLLMVDYLATIKTNGARTRDFLLSIALNSRAMVNNADSAHMILGIIEAKTGRVLWTNWNGDSEDLYSSMLSNTSSQDKKDMEKLKRIINPLLSPLKDAKK